MEVLILNVVLFSNTVCFPWKAPSDLFFSDHAARSLAPLSLLQPSACVMKVSSHNSLPYLESFTIPCGSFKSRSTNQGRVVPEPQPILSPPCPFKDCPSPTLDTDVKLSSVPSLLYLRWLHLGFSYFSLTSLSVFVSFPFAMCLFSICFLCSPNQMCVMNYQRSSQLCGQHEM